MLHRFCVLALLAALCVLIAPSEAQNNRTILPVPRTLFLTHNLPIALAGENSRLDPRPVLGPFLSSVSLLTTTQTPTSVNYLAGLFGVGFIFNGRVRPPLTPNFPLPNKVFSGSPHSATTHSNIISADIFLYLRNQLYCNLFGSMASLVALRVFNSQNLKNIFACLRRAVSHFPFSLACDPLSADAEIMHSNDYHFRLMTLGSRLTSIRPVSRWSAFLAATV